MRLSVAIGLGVGAWTFLVSTLLVRQGSYEYVAVLLLLAVLVAREVAGAYASKDLTARLGVFIFGGFVALLLVIVMKVRSIFNL